MSPIEWLQATAAVDPQRHLGHRLRHLIRPEFARLNILTPPAGGELVCWPTSCEVEAMPHYRLYFLHFDNRISRAIGVDCVDDEHAIEQAASFRYVHVIEVWQGTRLVKRIEPQ